MRRRHIPQLAIALIGAAALAGCGGQDPAVEAAAAAERTADVQSARVDVEGTVEGSALPGETSFEATGATDNERQVGELRFEEFEIAGAPPGVLPEEALQGEVVFEGLTIYMRLPLLSGQLPAGKEWLKLDLEDALGSQGVDLGQLTQVGQSNPTASLRQLQALTDDLEEVGEEEVRGVPTTHYRGTVDLSRYAEVVPEEERAAVEESVRALTELTGGETIPTDVWIDDEGLVRRFSQTYSYDAPTVGEITQTQTMELYDFGTEVDVEIPPAKDVFDATDLASRLPIP